MTFHKTLKNVIPNPKWRVYPILSFASKLRNDFKVRVLILTSKMFPRWFKDAEKVHSSAILWNSTWTTFTAPIKKTIITSLHPWRVQILTTSTTSLSDHSGFAFLCNVKWATEFCRSLEKSVSSNALYTITKHWKMQDYHLHRTEQ